MLRSSRPRMRCPGRSAALQQLLPAIGAEQAMILARAGRVGEAKQRLAFRRISERQAATTTALDAAFSARNLNVCPPPAPASRTHYASMHYRFGAACSA